MVKIMIDPGHGGKDGGASGNGIVEKDIVLAISKKITETLQTSYQDVQIKMTRNNDTFLTLEERTELANRWGADLFLSVHCNAAISKTAKGFETFIHPDSDAKTKAFQNVIHEEILKLIPQVTNRGKKQSNFHVLRETKMAALLSENLFVSNPYDANLLKAESFINRVALGHVNGVVRFFGLTKITIPPPPTNPTDEVLYQVVCGSFRERENAEEQVKRLKIDGYDSYILEKK